MLKEKQTMQGCVSFVDEDGNGVIKIKKERVLLRNVWAKEEVRFMIKKRMQQGYLGELVEVIHASPLRCTSPCPIYTRCGCCHLMHMDIKQQANWKKKQLQALCKHEKIDLSMQDIRVMDTPFHYRNKIIVGFQKDKSGRVVAGFYEEFSHRIIPYKTCLLHPKICDTMIATIIELVSLFHIELYDESHRRGLLRHVMLRYGEVSKQIMVVLVTNSNIFPSRKNFVSELIKRHPEITSIVQNINTRKTSIVLGEQERVLYGSGYIEDTLCGCTFRISPRSFYQINHRQTEVLYTSAVERLKLRGNECVLDAYCGIGTIGLYVAQFVKEVIGVEINKDAIQDAKYNAKINKISNIRFLCDDASRYMSKLAEQKKRLDIVIMDPPRSGSSETFIQSIAKLQVAMVLYISCNPVTQIRDIKYFNKLGYVVQGDLMPVDLFPFTNHVECVCLLTHAEK